MNLLKMIKFEIIKFDNKRTIVKKLYVGLRIGFALIFQKNGFFEL